MPSTTIGESPLRAGNRATRAWVNLGLLALCCGVIAVVNFATLPAYLPLKLSLRPATLGVLGGSTACEVMLLACVLALLRRGPASDLGWSRSASAAATRSGLLLGCLLALVTAACIPAVRVYAAEMSGFRAGAATLAVAAAIAEELIFRGYVMTELGRADVSVRHQIWISAALYALYRGLAWRTLFPLALLMGACWAVLYQVARRSLAPCLYSHVLLNLLIEPWVTMSLVHQFTRSYIGPVP